MNKIGLISTALLFAIASGYAHPAMKIAGNEIKDPTKTEKKMDKKAARKLEKKEVNMASMGNFVSDFGTMNDVEWSKSDYFDEARFLNNGQSQTAYYDINGALVGTTVDKSFADLPEHGQKQIKKMYKDYSINGVVFFRDNTFSDSDGLLYGSQFGNADNYFVELSKANDRIIVQVTPTGSVYFFKQLY
jgi:hypothetical protein